MSFKDVIKAIESMFGSINPFGDMPIAPPIEPSFGKKNQSQNAGQSVEICPICIIGCETLEQRLQSIKDSEFCEELKLIVQHEANFESSVDFARAMFDIDISSEYFLAGALEVDFLRNLAQWPYITKTAGHGYDRSIGYCLNYIELDMQYFLMGWAIEKQIVGIARDLYTGYSLFGRGLGNLLDGNGFKPNFLTWKI